MAAALLGGLGAIPTTASITQSGQSAVAGIFSKGFEVGWLGLLLLAGVIPIAPFSFLGYGGLNLMAVGATSWAAAKAATQGASALASSMIKLYIPKLWPWAWVLTYSPWYIFDLVQLMNPAFAKEGFKVPFFGKPVGGVGGVGKVTVLIGMAAVGLLSAGGYKLLDYLPPEIVANVKPIMQTIFLAIGGVTALAGGGLGAVMAAPQLLSAFKGVSGQFQGAPAAPPAPAPPPTQKGGAGASLGAPFGGNPGSAVPSLREIVDGMLGPAPAGDPAPYPATMPLTMKGGGLPDLSAYLFLGSLAALVAGGAALAVVRS